MKQWFYTADEVASMIEAGEILALAGDLELLAHLPKGKWIAATDDEFVENGKILLNKKDKIHVQRLTSYAKDVHIQVYDVASISSIYDDAPVNGFSILIMPWNSTARAEYSSKVPSYANFASKIVCGYIAKGYTSPKIPSFAICGTDVSFHAQNAVVMHIEIPADKYAELHTFTPNRPGKGETIVFEETTDRFGTAIIGGKRRNIREYLNECGYPADKDLIISGDFFGTILNANIVKESPETKASGTVQIGTPAYQGIEYKISEFNPDAVFPEIDAPVAFGLSCFTFFESPQLHKFLTQVNGPFCWGEVAYFLLNMSIVFVTVGDLARPEPKSISLHQ